MSAALRGRCRGSVLLVVLVVTVLLSLAVYTFSELSLSEAEATRMYVRGVQARAFAESGVEVALTLLGDRADEADRNFYHRPEAFAGLLMTDSDNPQARGRFSVIAPVENGSAGNRMRFGLIDESGKLNLNAAVAWNLEPEQARDMLIEIPGMTHEVADAIFDWIDDDSQPRQYGVESDYYQGMAQPYRAADAPLETLDELLLVRGVTPDLLFGQDQNRNGLIDPGEESGNPLTELGWSAYLTLFSRESNLRADGAAKINLNHENLPELYDLLEAEFDEEVARFVTAYRMKGASTGQSNQTGQQGRTPAGREESGSQPSTDEQSAEESESGVRVITSRDANQDTSAQQGQPDAENEEEKVTRGGMELTAKGSVSVNSIYDLFEVQVQATVNSAPTMLESPWSVDSGALQEQLPQLIDALSTSSAESIEGRVNVNAARIEVLLGVPEMTDDLAYAIAGEPMIGPGGEPLSDVLNLRATPGWLLLEGLADLELMRKIDRYITTRGDVYRAHSIGYFDAGGPYSHFEAVIDSGQRPPKLVFMRDLSELGGGSPLVLLRNL